MGATTDWSIYTKWSWMTFETPKVNQDAYEKLFLWNVLKAWSIKRNMDYGAEYDIIMLCLVMWVSRNIYWCLLIIFSVYSVKCSSSFTAFQFGNEDQLKMQLWHQNDNYIMNW